MRRSILKLWAAAAAGAAFVLLSGCGGGGKPVLHFYTWADYTDPGLIEEFEKTFNCRVVLDTFDSNETMFAKLKQGATGYDVIVPSSYMAKIMNEQGMLTPVDHSKVPNLQHIDRETLALAGIDKEMAYSVPYMVGTTGVAYLSDRVEDPPQSWAIFDNAEHAGRMSLLSDARETLGAALKFLGHSINTTDEAQINEAADVVLRWKKNIAKFDSEAYKPALASGEFFVVHGYNGDILQLIEDNENITYFVPEEGGSVYSDDFVIPKSAPNPELAHAFINFLHEPANAARNTEFVYFQCPNTPAYDLVAAEVREDPAVFPPREVLAKCEAILDLGPDNAKYTKAWDRVRSGE